MCRLHNTSGISLCLCIERAAILFFKLMSSCHKNDQESKILVAECLGELGAVDPGRLVGITYMPFPLHLSNGSALPWVNAMFSTSLLNTGMLGTRHTV